MITLKVSSVVKPLLMPVPTQTGSKPSGFGVPMGRFHTMAAWLNVVHVLVSLNAPAVSDQSRPRHKPAHAALLLKNHVSSVVDLFTKFHALSPPTTLSRLTRMVNQAKFGSIMATISTPAPLHQGYLHTRGTSLKPRSSLTQMQAPSRFELGLQPLTPSLLATLIQYSPTHVLLGMLSQGLVRQ